jgi:2-methylisocitrate lyase-like PEP mutase family enzyme
VVARTEALVAGLGQNETRRRDAAYAEAGADALLVHSREKTPDEILEFCHAWHGPVPLVLVPTAYPQLSFADVAALRKVGLIISAIRAAVAAMRATFARILAEGGIAGVEGTSATVAEIFALQGDDHMRELELSFLR